MLYGAGLSNRVPISATRIAAAAGVVGSNLTQSANIDDSSPAEMLHVCQRYLMKRLNFHHSISRAALALAGLCSWEARPTRRPRARSRHRHFVPINYGAGGSVVFSGQPGLDAPAGAERLSIRLSGVKVEGALPGFEADQKALESRLLRGPIPVSEVFSAARDLEASYARAGYVLVRVVLPAQTLRDGNVLRIVVVKGFVEKVEYKDVPEKVTKPHQRGDRSPRRPDRSSAAGDRAKTADCGRHPRRGALRFDLVPGATPGGAILVVQARYQMVSGFAGFDNTLSSSLGRSSLSLGLDTNSALGFGEIVYLRGSGHVGGSDANGYGGLFDEYPRVRTLAAGAVVPLGVDGLTFNLEATQSKTTPKPQGIQTFSEYERFSARLRYPWIRSRALTIGSELIFDATEDKQGLLAPGISVPYALDRLRILRAATDGSMAGRCGVHVLGKRHSLVWAGWPRRSQCIRRNAASAAHASGRRRQLPEA